MKNRLIFIVIILALLGCEKEEEIQEKTSSPKWTRKSDFVGGRRIRMFSFSINGKGYVGHGHGYNENDEYVDDLTDLWEYTPETDAWVKKNYTPFGSGMVGLSIGNKGYVIDPSFIWEYDQSLDQWEKVTFLPRGRFDFVSFSINDKIYLGTGNNSSGHLNDWWEYDVQLDKWTQKADVPTEGRNQCFAYAINGKGYLGLGVSDKAELYDDLLEYDPILDTWTFKQKPNRGPIPGSFISFSINSRIYIGYPGSTVSHLGNVVIYEPSTDTWKSGITFPSGDCLETTSFSVNNAAYVVGGNWWEFSDQVWEYTE